MQHDLSNYRQTYNLHSLREKDMHPNPMQVFQSWFFEAKNNPAVGEANAMSLSCVGTDGFPKTRVVLLKKFTEEGFIFFTNYHSEKGKAIASNPKVCLSFFWGALERQIIVKGEAEKLSEQENDAYFYSRPLGSQLGAVISQQSEVIPSDTYLEEQLKALERELGGQMPKRPAYWGGYLIRPSVIEFWQGRPNRLHDRFRYSLNEQYNWTMERLAP